ncbi:glycosyltransferase family 2 protein [Sphingomonas sp.]|uniref:glycosyltransferase family 2 protein n=1 Tax=Sphingomonas sp. TaxID=28214 RepID=UPI003D6CDAC5
MTATIIAIPTFRRPERLRQLLTSLARMKVTDDASILIADNDAAGRAGATLAEAVRAGGYALPIEIIIVAEPGLCAVRNAIVETALAHPDMRHLVMIDDDEWPEADWLGELLAVQRRTGADVVGGPVYPHFADRKPGWVRETLVFRPESRPEGATGMLWASNNLLVMRRALDRLDRPWFDPRFGSSGGEDLDFLTRLHEAGCRFAWAPAARVAEWVPADRARLGWVMRRMWRIGITDTMVRRKQAAGAARGLALTGRAVAILAARTVALPMILWPGARRVDVAGQWVKSWGRLYALAGGSDASYGQPAAPVQGET